MKSAQEYKAAGNELLKSGNAKGALGKYLKVAGCTAGLEVPAALMQSQELSLLAGSIKRPALTQDQSKQLADFMLTVHLNTAQAHLKLSQWVQAISSADRALLIDRQNVKALFRRGSALLQLNELPRAIADLEAASRLAPADALIAQHLQHARKRDADAANRAEAQMRQSFKGLFQS